MKKQNEMSRSLKLEWAALSALPVHMYQTVKGPLMGIFECRTNNGVRLWAPAWVSQPAASNIIFLPIFPIESYFDLSYGMVLGTHPVPEIIERGYRGYLQEFIKGSYKMNPVIVSGGIDGDPHTVKDENSVQND